MEKSKKKVERPERIPLQVLISYDKGDKPVKMFCQNLSTGGIFIETVEFVPKGTLLTINFTLPMEKESFNIDSRVVWLKQADASGPAGMGLEFENIDQATISKIDAALEYFKQIINR